MPCTLFQSSPQQTEDDWQQDEQYPQMRHNPARDVPGVCRDLRARSNGSTCSASRFLDSRCSSAILAACRCVLTFCEPLPTASPIDDLVVRDCYVERTPA
jgi:hypothetical protein